MSIFLRDDDEIELELKEDELWLIHDGFHYHDSGEMSKDIIQRAWYAILQMKDTKSETIGFPLRKDEILLILDRIPSAIAAAAPTLLTNCIRALWQLEYGMRVLDGEPTDDAAKQVKFATFKKRAKKGKSKLPDTPDQYETVTSTASS